MKRKSRIRNNSAVILGKMIAKGFSVGEAAKTAGLNADTFTRLIAADCPIHAKTASKLRNAFGEDAITILPPA